MIKTILTILVLSFPVFAQINQTFKREVILKQYKDGKVVAEHVRRSQFVRDDKGRLIEQVVFKTPNLKGISDKEVKEVAFRPQDGKVIEGVSQFFRDYDHREFGSTVEVKEVWDAHWPAGANVKVYFSTDFNNELHLLLPVLDAWNSLNVGVKFAYAGVAEVAQTCEGCLTVMRNPSLRDGGTFQYADRNSDGIIVYGRIYLRRLDSNLLVSTLAHEIGHSLSLEHSADGLMREKLPRGKRILPTEKEAELVRRALR